MDNLRKSQEFIKLVLKFREGQISEKELAQLNDILRNDPDARSIYVETLVTQSIFFGRKSSYCNIEGLFSLYDGLDHKILGALAENEDNADSIELIQNHLEAQDLMRRAERRIESIAKTRKIIFKFLGSIAAAFLIFLTLHFINNKPIGDQVAILADSIDARWSNNNSVIDNGTPFFTKDKSFVLNEGYAELLFNNQTRVTMEGPAIFQILKDNQIKLYYGKAYTVVSEQVADFVIDTPVAEVVDLGTEFGVEVASHGDTSVHVAKGRTRLTSTNSDMQRSVEIEKGYAKRVSIDDNAISDIAFEKYHFIRDIDSSRNILLQGDFELDLANVVAGGTGLDRRTKNSTYGIDIATGQLISNGNEEIENGAEGAGYVATPQFPFVDGVFVPDCGLEPSIVSSEGHIYSDFGDTGGKYYIPIVASYNVNLFYQYEKVERQIALKEYSPDDTSVICLHANAGITFDLEAIRSQLECNIVSFSSAYGISWVDNPRSFVASDFFVLVDGVARMVARNHSEADGTGRTCIPIDDGDRFLTLVCSEGKDNSGDWSMFVEPVLSLEYK